MEECINYFSIGALGDIFFQLSIIYENYIKTGKKGNYYIKDECFTGKDINKTYGELKILLDTQKYINKFELYTDQKYDIDLSKWRYHPKLFKPGFLWSQIFEDEYKIKWGVNKWIDVVPNEKYSDNIFFNYRHGREPKNQDFSFLKNQEKKVIFICNNVNDYIEFKRKTNIELEYLVFKDIYDMVSSIAGCYYFVGLLSAPLCIAISLHKPCLAFIKVDYWPLYTMLGNLVPNYTYYIDHLNNNVNSKYVKI